MELLRAAETKILSHSKMRKEANPYSAEWIQYFEQRVGDKFFESMNDRERFIEMWKKQRMRCVDCRDEINKESGWKLHFNDMDDRNRKSLVH